MTTRTGSKKHQQGMALRRKVRTAQRKINKILTALDVEIAHNFGILTEHDLTDEHGVTWAEREKYDEELTDD